VEPLPEPKIDPQDSKLAKALEAVAAIGSARTDDLANLASDENGKDTEKSGQEMLASHAPEPIELEPLPAPEPVEISPIAPTPSKPDRQWASTAAPGEEWKQLIEDAKADDSGEPPVESQPQVANAAELRGFASPAPKATVQPIPKTTPTTIFAMIGIAAMIFAVGFWLGRVTTISGVAAQADGDSDNKSDSTNGQKDNTDIAKLDSAIKGRITYQTEAGERRADKGARVIVLPVDRDGSARLPVAGFQIGAAMQDRRIAIASIREMGGDFCITTDDGVFDLKLKSSGQFHVLVLSNSLSREPSDEDPAVEQIVGQYFDRSNQLLGRVKYYMEKIRYSGDGTEPLDHSFQRT
jgi:hypothetical protein